MKLSTWFTFTESCIVTEWRRKGEDPAISYHFFDIASCVTQTTLASVTHLMSQRYPLASEKDNRYRNKYSSKQRAKQPRPRSADRYCTKKKAPKPARLLLNRQPDRGFGANPSKRRTNECSATSLTLNLNPNLNHLPNLNLPLNPTLFCFQSLPNQARGYRCCKAAYCWPGNPFYKDHGLLAAPGFATGGVGSSIQS